MEMAAELEDDLDSGHGNQIDNLVTAGATGLSCMAS